MDGLAIHWGPVLMNFFDEIEVEILNRQECLLLTASQPSDGDALYMPFHSFHLTSSASAQTAQMRAVSGWDGDPWRVPPALFSRATPLPSPRYLHPDTHTLETLI